LAWPDRPVPRKIHTRVTPLGRLAVDAAFMDAGCQSAGGLVAGATRILPAPLRRLRNLPMRLGPLRRSPRRTLLFALAVGRHRPLVPRFKLLVQFAPSFRFDRRRNVKLFSPTLDGLLDTAFWLVL
jgi:hypothetical protein